MRKLLPIEIKTEIQSSNRQIFDIRIEIKSNYKHIVHIFETLFAHYS